MFLQASRLHMQTVVVIGIVAVSYDKKILQNGRYVTFENTEESHF